MINKLVIASHNHGKIAELKKLLKPLSIEIKSATEFDINEPEETGKTFAENAEIKAVHSHKISVLPSLADDSGLCVEALDNKPGIYSRRWAGKDNNFSIAMEKIRLELETIGIDSNKDKAKAYFICALCLCDENGKIHHFEGRIDGALCFPPRGEKGFGYDSIFIPKNHDLSFAEISYEYKNKISHRAKAFEKLLNFLNSKS